MTFDEFWKAYPRKVARKPAEKEWSRLNDDEKRQALQALPNHIRAWEGKDADYIPHARTWLHQARWTDEIEPLQHKVTAWWTSPAAIDAKARELGIQASPGDGYDQLKEKIRRRLAA